MADTSTVVDEPESADVRATVEADTGAETDDDAEADEEPATLDVPTTASAAANRRADTPGMPDDFAAAEAPGAADDPTPADAPTAADDSTVDDSAADELVRIVLDDDVPEGLYTHADKEFVVYRSRHGYAGLKARTPRPLLTHATWEQDGTLVLTGDYPSSAPADPAELVLRSRDRNEERAFPMSRADGRFRAELPLSRLVSLGGVLPLPSGKWDIRVRRPASATEPAGPSLAVPLDHAALDRLPVETTRTAAATSSGNRATTYRSWRPIPT